jgi:hypothetical protein
VDPHLPEEHRDQPTRSAGKTVVLWILLILMFIAFYQLFAMGPPSGREPIFKPWHGGAGALIASVVALVAWLGWLNRRTRAFNVENEEAMRALGRGERERAVQIFDRLVTRYKRPRSVQMVARYNLGWGLLQRGELARAAEVFASVDRARSLVFVSNVHYVSPLHLATTYALLGQLDAAARWIAEGEKRVRAGGGSVRAVAGPLELARAIVACRRGAPGEAAVALETSWRELESALTGELLRPLRLLRAFAVAQSESARGSGAADVLLTPLRGALPDEFAWLATGWPELRAFLATHPRARDRHARSSGALLRVAAAAPAGVAEPGLVEPRDALGAAATIVDAELFAVPAGGDVLRILRLRIVVERLVVVGFHPAREAALVDVLDRVLTRLAHQAAAADLVVGGRAILLGVGRDPQPRTAVVAAVHARRSFHAWPPGPF